MNEEFDLLIFNEYNHLIKRIRLYYEFPSNEEIMHRITVNDGCYGYVCKRYQIIGSIPRDC